MAAAALRSARRGRRRVTLETGTALRGRYRLEGVIGSGSAGVVWRARDVVLDRPVAVKVLHRHLAEDTDAAARFRREAVAAADLGHPHVVRIHDVGEQEARPYIVMELVEGPTLAALIAAGPLAPDVVATIGHHVAGALGAAHDRGLVHRDVKPANVLLTPEGMAKIVDFGVAKTRGATQSTFTAPGLAVGTVAYLAPEQLEGVPIDGRVDVYALGLVLHEALSGRPAFEGDTPSAVAASRLVRDPPPPRDRRPDVPADLDAAIVQATRRERDQRFLNAAAFARALATSVPADGSDRVAAAIAAAAGSAANAHGEAATRVLPSVPAEGGADPPRAPTRERAEPASPATAPPPPAVPLPATTDDGEPSAPPPRRGVGVTTAVLIAIALLAVVAVLMLPGRREAGDGGATTPAGEPPVARGAPVAIVDARDHDPFGDGEEHREEVAKAYDGDPGSAWETERYSSADLGGLKPGVGIWFDLGRPATVRAVELVTGGGLTLELYASDSPPEGGPESQPVATADVGSQHTVEVPEGVRARFWLLWIRSAAGGRAEIAEVRFVPR